MSVILLFCLVTVTSSVVGATIPKHKSFVEYSVSPKTDVVSVDVLTFEGSDYRATDNFIVNSYTVSNLVENDSFTVNLFLKPENVRFRYNKVIHKTLYLANIPKEYLLPPKNSIWLFGSNIRQC